MFQDIAPFVYSNDFSWSQPEPQDCVLVYNGENVLAKQNPDASLTLPTFADFHLENILDASSIDPNVAGHASGVLYLFSVGETDYYRVYEAEEKGFSYLNNQVVGDPWAFLKLAELHFLCPSEVVFAALVGYQYFTWYESRKFCGRCGALMEHDSMERMMRCPECDLMEFPKLFPAVIVAITNGDKVLVSKYAGREYTRFALIAGFAEMGETIEQTVHREVMEEVGLRVKNLRYYKSQPWPFSSSLLMGFFCDLDGSDEVRLDTHELQCAVWMDRADLPKDMSEYSLTRDMMRVLRLGLDCAEK